jgi:hypothetical protein
LLHINNELITWGTLLGSDNKVASIILSSFRPPTPLARLRGAAAACVFLLRFSSVASLFFSLPILQKNYRDEGFVIESFDGLT